MNKAVISCAFALVALSIVGARAADVPSGVYECFGRLAATIDDASNEDANAPDASDPSKRSDTAGATSTSASPFSVISPGTYMGEDGSVGHFSFDGLTLSLIDGSYAGQRFHKATPAWTLRMLKRDGGESAVMCPRNTTKDRNDPNAW